MASESHPARPEADQTPRLALVLHGHLPFVRHPELPQFHEETWLFEAILECYLPLLEVLEGWHRDHIPGRLTLSVSPTLAAMLGDTVLRERFHQYWGRIRELAQREELRALFEPERRAVAALHLERLEHLGERYRQLGGDLLTPFAECARHGQIELITCSATHATLPLLRHQPGCLRAQLEVALDAHAQWTGTRPRGFWLPECAWIPELGPHLAAAGIGWVIVETHGLMHGNPRPRQAIFAPVLTPDGVAVFGRDPASARQVWSREGGYPGDPRYREFHHDVAHDAEWDYVRPYLHGAASRAFTGLKFHRVTGAGREKEYYDRRQALEAAAEHAAHFVRERVRLGQAAAQCMRVPPLFLAPYDAELFGHWWFEGPEFLDAVFRTVHASDGALALVTPSDRLHEPSPLEVSQPAASTWGEGGHFAIWLDDTNAWMQPQLRQAGARFESLVRRFESRPTQPTEERLLRQAGRELLLAQASDWPFLVKLNTAGTYPSRRFREHIEAFDQIARVLEHASTPDLPSWLPDLETRHNLFPDLNWRHWIPRAADH